MHVRHSIGLKPDTNAEPGYADAYAGLFYSYRKQFIPENEYFSRFCNPVSASFYSICETYRIIPYIEEVVSVYKMCM